MLSLLAAALVIKSLQPLQELPLPDEKDHIRVASYARDDSFEYLGTPDGLYRAPRLATGTPEKIAFAGENVTAVATHEGTLYVAKGRSNYAVWPQHTLLRSRDRGATFEPIDVEFYFCIANIECGYLVPEQIRAEGDRLFVEAGGNLLVSANDGATWEQLWGEKWQGRFTSMSCPITFERVGETMLIGGECPLDWGFIRSGRLRPDLLGWISPSLENVKAPEMENRNVQFIRHIGNNVVYAGIEGALMKSTDGGVTFRYVVHYPLEAHDRYPYIGHMVVSTRDPQLMVIGGFDKKNLTGYLAYSNDGGETWQDVSPMVGEPYVVMLAEDAGGRILIGIDGGVKLTLAEIVFGGATPKRRAVR
jgi:photosystem II stability/assembly factor-like uncharacterized protein